MVVTSSVMYPLRNSPVFTPSTDENKLVSHREQGPKALPSREKPKPPSKLGQILRRPLELRFDAIKELPENLTEFGTRANLPLTVAERLFEGRRTAGI